MLGSLKARALEGSKQLKSKLEEHTGVELNAPSSLSLGISSASEKLSAAAAAAAAAGAAGVNMASTPVHTASRRLSAVAIAAATQHTNTGANGTKEPDEVLGGPFFAALAFRQEQVHIGHKALLDRYKNLDLYAHDISHSSCGLCAYA